jgi:predicted amidophosphoribosyltransferase
MELQNCPRCGKVFTFFKHDVCRDCLPDELADFNKVRSYLEQNPGANIFEVGRETGVKRSVLYRFFRSGRLSGK